MLKELREQLKANSSKDNSAMSKFSSRRSGGGGPSPQQSPQQVKEYFMRIANRGGTQSQQKTPSKGFRNKEEQQNMYATQVIKRRQQLRSQNGQTFSPLSKTARDLAKVNTNSQKSDFIKTTTGFTNRLFEHSPTLEHPSFLNSNGSARQKLYLRMLMRLTQNFKSHANQVAVGPVIKDVLDRFLKTGRSFENATFYKLKEEVQDILDLPNNEAICKTMKQKNMSAATSPRDDRKMQANRLNPLDKAKNNFEEVKQRMQNFKDEYRRNFVDINFYGMQSKVSNPMNQPDWTKTVRNKISEEHYNDSMRKIKEKYKSLNNQGFDAMLPPSKNDLSHEERQAKKKEIVGKFKHSIESIQENPEASDPYGKAYGKYTDILATSFKPNDSFCLSPNPNSTFVNDRKELEKAMIPLGVSDSKLENFQRKSIKSVNKDGKLWLILDKLKNAQNTQSLKIEADNKKEQNKKYLDSLDTQMKERNFLKQMVHQDVQMEKLEVDQELAEYAVEKEKIRQEAEKKRLNVLDMMHSNLRVENQMKEKRRLEEKAQSILVNQKKILNMGEQSKLRQEQFRITKARDDTFNRSCEVDHRVSKVVQRKQEKEQATQIPFYERLRHHSETFDQQLRRTDRQAKEQQTYRAAYIDGTCLIDDGKIDKYQKVDGIRANLEAKVRDQAYDDALERKNSVRLQKEKQISSENYGHIVLKNNRPLKMQVVDKQKEHDEAMKQSPAARVYATIKLPEILSGWEDKDFRRDDKEKKGAFKDRLDELRRTHADHTGIYHGMTESEILLNRDKFLELGLL